MPKFRPPSLAQMCASITFNESQLIALIEKGLNDNSLRGFLFKRSSTNSKWRLKWFLLFENLLFYFDVNLEQAAELAAGGGAAAPRSLGSFIRRQSKSSSSGTSASQQQPAPFWQQLAIKELMSSPVARRASVATTTTGPSPATTTTASTAEEQLVAPLSSLPQTHWQPAGPAAASAGQLDELVAPGSCHSIHQPDSSGCQHHQQQRTGASSAADQRAGCGAPEAIGKVASSTQKPAPPPPATSHQPPPKTTTTTTSNSSSISGVSNHFQAHNEQTIGRSTTTSAGKTALPTGTNYANLLSRKIGVLFLEGSHCERVCDPNGLAGFRPGSATGNMQSQQPFRCSSGQLSSCATDNGFPSPFTSDNPNHRQPSLVSQQNYTTNTTTTTGIAPDESEGSKEYHFRSETEAECRTWVHALSQARYSVLLNDKEQLEQKFLHLSQIIESESTAKWHYARQCEDSQAEIKKLRQEICHLRRQENRSNHFRLVLAKQSAALVESIAEQKRTGSNRSSGILASHLEHHPAQDASSCPLVELDHEPLLLLRGASPTSTALVRARSMEQEQAEHDVAVRRTKRLLLTNNRRHQPPVRVGSFDHHSSLTSRYRRPLIATSSMNYSSAAGAGAILDEAGEMQFLSTRSKASTAALTEGSEAIREGLGDKLRAVIEALNEGFLLSDCMLELENSEEIKKIKKVQGFFRGWLCRRRWKQIVQEYIKSPHAESMRKRNNLVFRMVECEEEYVEQLSLLVSAFLRPLKMAASSQRPALDHDEVNSIFLNSETLLFLHQIFLKGLTARMESWPTLVLADLFTMLLPMLTIYQEYVRNHHFSIQVLAECKQREPFAQILKRLEDKPQLNGRTLETLLTYPMHQIPRYIICLHEILAHTPHNHVERVHLYTAQTKLEELSRQIHEEVSATESIRHNLAIERMIIGGCDILLDVSQVFVRQGVLTQVVRVAAAPGGRKQSSSKAARQAAAAASTEPKALNGVPTQPFHSSTSSVDGRWQHQLHHLEQRVAFNESLNSLAGSQCASSKPHPVKETQIKTRQLGSLSEATQARRFSLSHRCSNAAAFVTNKQRWSGGCAPPASCSELVRQCFLFTNHLLLCTREKDGALDLVERISLSEVTLVENPVEFMQQQQHLGCRDQQEQLEQDDADKMLVDEAQHQNHHQAEPNSDLGLGSTKLTCHTSFYAPARDYTYQLQDGATPAGTGDTQTPTKRPSTASEPAKWATPAPTRSANTSILASQAGSGSSAASTQQLSSSPSRASRSLTGYLASKLSTLTSGQAATNVAGSGSGGCSSASAPASPLNKRRKNSQNAATMQQNLQASALDLASATTCRDYASRDFLLLVESSGKQCSSSQQTYALYLVAPSLQEKAAWMSDISQVSSSYYHSSAIGLRALSQQLVVASLAWPTRKLDGSGLEPICVQVAAATAAQRLFRLALSLSLLRAPTEPAQSVREAGARLRLWGPTRFYSRAVCLLVRPDIDGLRAALSTLSSMYCCWLAG